MRCATRKIMRFVNTRAQMRFMADSTTMYKRALAAINDTSLPPKDLDQMSKLKMYALFKQIESGPCSIPKPSMFDMVGRAKHDAWSQLGSMTKEEAMQKYVSIATGLFDGKIPDGDSVSSAANVTVENNETTATPSPPKKVTVASIAFPKLQAPHSLSELNLTSVIAEPAVDGVQNIVLNRPKRGNAFDMKLWEEYQQVFRAVDASTETKVVILSGAGGNFSTGMDLTVFADMNSAGLKESCEGRRREGIARFIQYLQDATSAPETCAVPVIAAVAGHCIGGAIDIITACDLRYCTKDALFCVKEIDLAIVSVYFKLVRVGSLNVYKRNSHTHTYQVADMGTLQRLPRIVGDQRAAELTYTGRVFSGMEAKQMGLVLECFETAEEMNRHVNEVARAIASKSPLTTRYVLALYVKQSLSLMQDKSRQHRRTKPIFRLLFLFLFLNFVRAQFYHRGVKQTILYSREHTVRESLQFVKMWNSAYLQSDDLMQAMGAVMAKKTPEFKKN